MGRNQPFDFSDDDDTAFASGGANTMDAEYTEFGWTDSPEMNSATENTAQTARQQSQTATHARRSAEQQDTPTSMSHKRGNQPR